MNKYLFMFDLDGTLLNDNQKISPYTKNALKNIHDNGHFIAINTMRNLKNTEIVLDDIKFDYLCCSGGNYILDIQGNSIEKRYLSEKDNHLIYNILKSFPGMQLMSSEQENEVFTTGYDYAQANGYVYSDKETMLNDNSYKLVFSTDITEYGQIEDALKDYAVIPHKYSNLFRVMPKGTSKANAIKILKRDNDLTIVSFGDADFDLEMLLESDMGIRMINSDKSLFENQSLKYTTDFSNNEDGVAKFIESHFNLK